MGKYSFGLNKALAQEELSDSFYSGPTPPKGNYHAFVKQLVVKKNRNDDPMLNYLLEINEEEGTDKAQYNGYGIWGNLNVTDQGAAWVNNFLDGIGAKREDFWGDNVTVDGAKPPNILKIGAKKPVGTEVFVSCIIETYNGNDNLRARTFLLEDAGTSGKRKAASEPEPDDDVAGLEDADTDDTDTGEDAEGQYTEEELQELSPADLKGILDDWGVEYAPKATKATLVKTVLAQYEAEEADETDEEEAAEEADETDEAEAEDEAEPSGDELTEEDMGEMSTDELKEYITDQGWTMPKPPVRSRLMKAILQFQAEPPF